MLMRAAAALFHQQPAFCHKYSWLLRFIHQFVMHWLLLVLIIQGSSFKTLSLSLLYARTCCCWCSIRLLLSIFRKYNIYF